MPEIGAEGGVSLSYPHIGAIFEGSRIFGKGADQWRRPLVEVFHVWDPNETVIWTFRNYEAWREFGQFTSDWFTATIDYKTDIETAANKGKRVGEVSDPTPEDPTRKKAVYAPLTKIEFDEARKSESIMKAMMAVSSSARAMEQSAGVMDAYVMAMVGKNEDHADTWQEFLIHKDSHKLDILRGERYRKEDVDRGRKKKGGSPVTAADIGSLKQEEWNNGRTELKMVPERGIPIVVHYWEKLRADVSEDTPEKIRERIRQRKEMRLRGDPPETWPPIYKSKMVEYLDKRGRHYKEGAGGMKEYVFDFLLNESDAERERLVMEFGVDSQAMAAAAKLVTDIFLVDEYTSWEFGIHCIEEEFYEEKRRNRTLKEGPKDEMMQLKPVINWGGNPLTCVLEPSYLFRHVKRVYADSRGIELLDAVDDAFRMEIPSRMNPSFAENRLQPTMLEPLKALMRYARAISNLAGSSRANSLAGWDREALYGREVNLQNVFELMDQVEGDLSGVDRGEDMPELPFGKHAMGWFTAKILNIKARAALLEIAKRGVGETITVPEDEREELFSAARWIAGDGFKWKSGLMRELASSRTRFTFAGKSIIPETWELISEAVDMLRLKGDYGEKGSYLLNLARGLISAGDVVAKSGTGGGKGKRQ